MRSDYFNVGQVYATAAVNDRIQEDGIFWIDVMISLGQFCGMDWGKLCEEDAQMSNEAVVNGNDRIMGAYDTVAGEIWIITEADRSATTILFPSDY